MGANGQFHLADVIIEEEKYFDISLQEVLRQHSRNRKFEIATTVEVLDGELGEVVEAYLVLKVSGRLEYFTSWDIALLLHDIRIDGFGFEQSWTDSDGIHAGWHRHVWNGRLLHAKRKHPVQCFESANIFQHFVTTAFKEMNIRLSGRDDGNLELF
jgi:hypothetical protein